MRTLLIDQGLGLLVLLLPIIISNDFIYNFFYKLGELYVKSIKPFLNVIPTFAIAVSDEIREVSYEGDFLYKAIRATAGKIVAGITIKVKNTGLKALLAWVLNCLAAGFSGFSDGVKKRG